MKDSEARGKPLEPRGNRQGLHYAIGLVGEHAYRNDPIVSCALQQIAHGVEIDKALASAVRGLAMFNERLLKDAMTIAASRPVAPFIIPKGDSALIFKEPEGPTPEQIQTVLHGPNPGSFHYWEKVRDHRGPTGAFNCSLCHVARDLSDDQGECPGEPAGDKEEPEKNPSRFEPQTCMDLPEICQDPQSSTVSPTGPEVCGNCREDAHGEPEGLGGGA